MPTRAPDPFFDKSVIYICAESEQGVMGVMINKPMRKIKFSHILSELRLNPPYPHDTPNIPVMRGGPIETSTGFILHSADYDHPHTVKINPFSSMTATIDILKDIVSGTAPKQHLIALGYAGWEQPQLIEEMENNLWLTVPATPELLFDVPFAQRWAHALRQAGIAPEYLSFLPGTA